MNEFQLGLKLQLSGVDAAEGMLNGFTKSLDQQLEGIKGFTKQLGQGNETVRGYIDSAKKMIEQNPIGETMGKLSGLAKTLGLDQVATGIAETGNSVRAWTGELTSFLGSAQGASATIKQVLQGDVNVAINSVKTGLSSLGNMADLANKMGLPGVATGINDIATNVGSWVGKVQEFQGATEATAAKLNTAFGGSIHPNVLKLTSGLMEMTGVSKDILPHLDGVMKQFESLTGKSFPEAFKGMQGLSKEFGNGGLSASKLGEMLKTPMGPSQALAGGLGIVGAAIAGWQIGKAIGEMDIFGAKINDIVQYTILKGMEIWTKFKTTFGFGNKEALKKELEDLQAAQAETLLRKNPPPEKKEDEGKGAGGFDRKKFDHEQMMEKQRALEEGRADRAKEAAEKQAATQLAAIEKTFQKDAGDHTGDLETRLAAANKAETDSKAVLEKREAAANEALEVRIKNINAQIAEVNNSKESDEGKTGKLAGLQNSLEELKAQQTAVHEETEKEKTAITEKYTAQRKQMEVDDLKLRTELKEKAEAEAKKKADEKAKAEMDAAKKLADDREKEIKQIEEENKKLDDQIKKVRELEGKTKDKKEKEKLHLKGDELERRKKKVPGQSKATKEKQDGDGLPGSEKGKKGEDKEGSKDKAKQVLALGQQIQQTFDDIANSGIQSVQDSITGLINGTMTWKDALSHVGSSVMDSLMNGFMKMVQTQITGLFTVDAAKDKISLGQRIRNMAEAMSNMPNALLSSITSWGSAATIGLAAVTAAMSAFGGFESGGYTGDGRRSEVAGLVHRGEMVFDQPAVQAIGKDRLEAMRMNRIMPTGLAGSGGAGGGAVKPMMPNINVQSAQPKVIVVNSQEELMKVMKGSVGEEITVAHIAKNKLRLGMAS